MKNDCHHDQMSRTITTYLADGCTHLYKPLLFFCNHRHSHIHLYNHNWPALAESEEEVAGQHQSCLPHLKFMFSIEER